MLQTISILNKCCFLTFYSSKNPEKMCYRFHKNIKQLNCFQYFELIYFDFLSRKSAYILKGHMTLKTGVMMLSKN